MSLTAHQAAPAALRIIVAPYPSRPGTLTAHLEDGSIVVASSRQPLVDSARELLARGVDPSTPLAMRHAGKAYDSFAQPAPIGELARWTYSEPDSEPLRRRLWTADCRRPRGPKVDLGDLGGSRAPARQIAPYESPAHSQQRPLQGTQQ